MERRELTHSNSNRVASPSEASGNPERTPKQYAFRLTGFAAMWLVVAFPFAMIHLAAIGLRDTPGSPAITTRQGLTAAAANPLGPWAGHVVRNV
jgi:hypothetical protein